MSKPSEILADRIDLRLADLDRSKYWLSREITDGKHGSTIGDIRRKGSIPNGDRLARIAAALQTTPDYLLGRASTADIPVSEARFSEAPAGYGGHNAALSDFPILGTGYCANLSFESDDGTIDVEPTLFEPGHVVRMVVRPPALAGVPEAYAIYFVGDSMSPRFESGEMGIVDPRRPVGRGDDVVVQLNNGRDDDVVTVLVKRLARQSASWVELHQFNPAVTFRVPRERIARMHRIIPVIDLYNG